MALVCWKWGDWRNWKKYYSTILFFIIWGLLYSYMTVNYPLWRLDHPLFKHTYSDLIISFIAYPSVVMLYLPYLPISLVKRIANVFLWVTIFATLELVNLYLAEIHYYHGWKFGYSVAFNFLIFLLLRLHFYKPLAAWAVSIAGCIAILIIFKFPVMSVI
ncbi:MAG TPA: CBO0543 family protein [Syntrophomonadaceae bacterium]|nr:CBO0543 family protein [Syntrophomonadaceae bacterium]